MRRRSGSLWMLMAIRRILIQQLVGLVGHIRVKQHLGLRVWWNGRAIIRIMAEINSKLMCEKVRVLKESSIPHLNPMKWNMRMSGNTTVTAPKAGSETIPTSILAGGLLAIWAGGPRRKGFVSNKFYEDAMPSIEIFSMKFILSLTIIIRLHLNHTKVYTHLSSSSGPLWCRIRERAMIVVGLMDSRRPCTLFCRGWWARRRW